MNDATPRNLDSDTAFGMAAYRFLRDRLQTDTFPVEMEADTGPVTLFWRFRVLPGDKWSHVTLNGEVVWAGTAWRPGYVVDDDNMEP
jgi:hypothetical protein